MRGWREDLRVVVWLLPVIGSDMSFGDFTAEVALVVGVLVGVLWQVLSRREVGGRLVVLAILGLVGGLVWVASTGGDSMGGEGLSVALYGLGVACAVVLTEQVLLRRDLGPVTLDMVHAPDGDDAAQRPG